MIDNEEKTLEVLEDLEMFMKLNEDDFDRGKGMILLKKFINSQIDKNPSEGSLPHESEIENALDTLMIIRGDHKDRVRNPIYGEERKLAKDLVKWFIIENSNKL